ncbi:MAG: hypothetical protein WDN23_11755 [Edaphobacter sp.]
MATPDYLQQVIISGRNHTGSSRREIVGESGWFRRPSVLSSVWASVDMLTVVAAAMLALRFRVETPPEVSTLHVLPHLIHSSPGLLPFYIGWFGVCLVFFTRSYGLYGPIQNRSGLHEQRMTVQAALTSGLLLCGTLYLSSGEAISRVVVALMVLFTTSLLCLRRAMWRKMVYRRFRAGVETRNVLIVGAGRVGQALRNHIDTLQHLGFRFKGFVALSEREAESGDMDVIGDVRNCLSLARSLFVDEIFFSVPAEKKLVIGMVEEARIAGIDVRRGAGYVRRPGMERQGRVYRPVPDNSAASEGLPDWRHFGEAGAGYFGGVFDPCVGGSCDAGDSLCNPVGL